MAPFGYRTRCTDPNRSRTNGVVNSTFAHVEKTPWYLRIGHGLPTQQKNSHDLRNVDVNSGIPSSILPGWSLPNGAFTRSGCHYILLH